MRKETVYWKSRIERVPKRAARLHPQSEPEMKERCKEMYAIIKTGGKQYKVSEGDEIYVEKLDLEDGATVDFEVLMVEKDGALTMGGKVSGKVVKTGKQKKVIVYKMKPKKNYRRKQGHRQPYTKVVIETIA